MSTSGQDKAIALAYGDYFELLDWTGRAMRADKRGSIPEHLQPILARLGIDDSDHWIEHIRHFRRCFSSYVGRAIYSNSVSSCGGGGLRGRRPELVMGEAIIFC